MSDPKLSESIISSETDLDPGVNDAQDEADSSAEMELRHVNVSADSHGGRLDKALAELMPEFSRSYLQQLIEAGSVWVEGRKTVKPSSKVKAGVELTIELRPTPQSQAFKAETMELEVVFEDSYLLVINKPAGLVVHPAPGNWSGTLLNGLLARDPQAAYLPRTGIVHRLDKDTSGLMVVARQRQTMDQLVSMIAARSVSREYIALAHGAWQGAQTLQVEAPIGRDPRNRLRMAAVDLEKNSGKPALTVLSLLQSVQRHCLVKCRLHTGRTHQIRVHMALLGHPLVSDVLYGGAIAGGMQRQALHACRLAFDHPMTGATMEFKSPPPPDLREAIANFGLICNQLL